MKTKTNKAIGALTSGDLDKIAELLDNRLAPMATKEFVHNEIANEIAGVRADMQSMESRLKSHINEGIETVMTGMDNLLVIKTGKRS